VSASGVPKKRRRWIWWVVLGVVVVVVAAIVIPMLTTTSSTTTYTTATVTRQTLDVTVSGSGNGVVSDATEVQPSITGTVKDLSVKLGQSVVDGDLLFKIVNADLDAAVERAEGSLTQAKQQLLNAKTSVLQAEAALDKAETPNASGTVDAKAVKIAKQQLASAKLGRTSAGEGLTSAESALSQAEDSADARTVTAPVSGVITVLNAQNGQSLSGSSSSSSGNSAASASSSSNSAVEISDLSTLYAQVQINEIDLVNVKVGQPAAVTFDALPTVIESGTVNSIAPTGISSSGVVTYNVNISLVNPDPRLRPTMSCTAVITTAVRPDALVIPSSAVRLDSTTQKNYVLVGNTSTYAISQVNVTTGVVVGTETEILSGLTAGQTVLIGGTSGSTSSTSTTGSTGARGGGGGLGLLFGRG
jgi:RND family efflux transporter MFP subunit